MTETLALSPTHPSPPRIRSFVRRAGRMTGAQRLHFDQAHPYCFHLPLTPTETDQAAFMAWFTQSFEAQPEKSRLPLALDIGFGMGDSTVPLAMAYPEYRWIAIDVHPPGIGRLLNLINQSAVNHVRVVEGDTLDVLAALPDNSIALCKVFFPDPWPKKRQQKRRLLQVAFADLLAQKTQAGGLWHIATDIDDYGEQIRQAFLAHPLWHKVSDHINDQPHESNLATLDDRRLLRPPTKFARRAIEEGRRVHSLAYLRR